MARWNKILSRGNVVDRRGSSMGLGGLGLGGVAIVVAFTLLTGGNVSDLLPLLNQVELPTENSSDFEGADSYEVFASTVLGSNNDLWSAAFAKNYETYIPPTLVLFRNATESGCGLATSDVGPHYCPIDQTIYLDETFFDELQSRFGAEGGDVAEAYVIGHEVGHHVQNLLGTLDEVDNQTTKSNENELSVKLELQADCYAGLWAYSIKNQGVFLPGEIKEALDAAAAVGDDRIQEATTGRVRPETFTHGSSSERVSWFTVGYDTGEFSACNTFGT